MLLPTGLAQIANELSLVAHENAVRPCFQRTYGSGQGRARTADTGLFRAVLYQLSYLTNLYQANNCLPKLAIVGLTAVYVN